MVHSLMAKHPAQTPGAGKHIIDCEILHHAMPSNMHHSYSPVQSMRTCAIASWGAIETRV